VYNMTNHYAICLLMTLLLPFASCSDEDGLSREEKLISTFQVVRFPNDGCKGSNSRNGTCYTSQECSNKGGTSSGSCADGFGVCCTFLISTCGSSTSENLTSWKQPTTVSSGSCSLDVSPVSDDICMLRLDFTTFVISGPNTHTAHSGRRRLGGPDEVHPDNYVLGGVNWSTGCLTDAFYVTGASPSSNPPVICGTVSGDHMYVEADIDRGNKLMFNFADAGTTTASITRGIGTLATRTWDMTISHIECSSLTLPPIGCTKYFWNAAGRATLNNYNWDSTEQISSIHLGQQHERFCIRRERGKCVGCFSAAAGDFDVSAGNEQISGHFTVANGCCGYTTEQGIVAPVTIANVQLNGYGNAAGGQFGWDCVIIPGAFFLTNANTGAVDETQTTALMQQVMGTSPTAAHMNVPSGPQICGTGAGIGPGKPIMTQTSATNALAAIMDEGLDEGGLTVCTRSHPFIFEFMSDDIEGQGTSAAIDVEFNTAAGTYNQGFNIQHTQLDC